MKVNLKIAGIRKLRSGFTPHKEALFDFTGESIKDLIQELASRMGEENRELFIEREEISSDLGTIVNGTLISDSNRGNFRLREGDSVELISSPG